MATEMKSLSPNLMVKDVSETLRFYIDKLRFEKIATVPETEPFLWAMVKSGDVTFMFQQTNSIKEEYPELEKFEQGGGLSFYITITGLQQLFDQLKDKVKILKEIHTTPYGATEFAIEDCNGYILTFSQAPA